jgi:hypothetical protein
LQTTKALLRWHGALANAPSFRAICCFVISVSFPLKGK